MSGTAPGKKLNKIVSSSRVIVGGLADLLFPPACALCGELLDRPAPPVCPVCREGFEPIPPPVCPRCGQPFQGAGTCPDCRREESVLAMVRSGFAFGGSMAAAILKLKFGHARQLAPYLAAKLLENRPADIDPAGIDLLVPVPLHRRRMTERGFNQSLLLAREMSAGLDVALSPAMLVRRQQTAPQSKTHTRRQRAENLRGAFELRARARIEGLRICLVDDVVTTGATLEACARALQPGRPKTIVAITLARTLHA